MPEAQICFLERNERYLTEKPYAIQFEPHGDVPQSNVLQELVLGIQIRDIRPEKDDLTLEKNGLLVRDLITSMKKDDFAAPDIVQSSYLPEVQQLLCKTLGTENVAILEYLVRRRHPVFPLSPGKEYEQAQPVPNAHIDFSPKGIKDIIIDRYGEERAEVLCRHQYKIVNIWKPLFGPLLDWPLCFCQPRSLSPDDLELMDNVFPKNVEESITLHYSPQQDWCYLDRQLDTEVIVFQGGDSKLGIHGGVPHCSFEDERYGRDITPRESIEVRALVFFAEEDLRLERVIPSRLHGPKSTFAQDVHEKNHH